MRVIDVLIWGFILPHLAYALIGLLSYICGFKRFGHKCIAIALAADLGLFPRATRWLRDKCPDNQTKCATCKIWTCESYRSEKACCMNSDLCNKKEEAENE
jgi:hypothetical protein